MTNFKEIGERVAALVEEKNRAYGSSFDKAGEFLKLLYPNGVTPEQFTDMLCMVRIFDKQMRIATDRDALGESPYQDIIGYGILGLNRVETNRQNKVVSHPLSNATDPGQNKRFDDALDRRETKISEKRKPSTALSPEEFKELENRISDVIPDHGTIKLAEIVTQVATKDSGFTNADVKAALLNLKAEGIVQLDYDNGLVTKTAQQK